MPDNFPDGADHIREAAAKGIRPVFWLCIKPSSIP